MSSVIYTLFILISNRNVHVAESACPDFTTFGATYDVVKSGAGVVKAVGLGVGSPEEVTTLTVPDIIVE
jgi:hypothetical protein